LTLPAACAPMFLVSGPDLVLEACKSGVIGVLPRQNARTIEQFDGWMEHISAGLSDLRQSDPGARIAPLAVNLATRMSPEDLSANLAICRRSGVEIVISATGDPTELTKRVHDWGGKVFHDVTNMRFAEKAISAGVDGLTCIGAGGGGHSGTISHLALIPKVRSIFSGVILMAGAISNGAAIRAAEVLGADLAYLGTRFIATRESMASPEYKALLVGQSSAGLSYTADIAGAPANWLMESMRMVGLDPSQLPKSAGFGRYEHLPKGARPWVNIWSAGQGIDLIQDIPSVHELVGRLRAEYVEACEVPSFADVARIVDQALDSSARI
jgi:nitronate monooxygenase